MSAGKLVIVGILVTVLLAGVGLYADVSELAGRVVSFEWLLFLPALALAFANYVIRFIKWHYFLARVGGRVAVRDSAGVFFAGLSMAVTPGKVGELLKAVLLNAAAGVPVSTSAPVVVAERLTDLIALMVLAVFGVAASGYGWDLLAVAAGLCGAVMALALWRRGGSAALRLLAWIPAVRARAASFAELQDAMFRLVGPWPLLVGTALSVAAWFAECVAFQVVLAGAGVEFALGGSVFVYSLGTIAGAVSMLPGGLVATEAGMVAMVVELFRAAPREAGVTAVLVVRLATLWFAVAVGLLALGWMRGRLAARALTAGDEKG